MEFPYPEPNIGLPKRIPFCVPPRWEDNHVIAQQQGYTEIKSWKFAERPNLERESPAQIS